MDTNDTCQPVETLITSNAQLAHLLSNSRDEIESLKAQIETLKMNQAALLAGLNKVARAHEDQQEISDDKGRPKISTIALAEIISTMVTLHANKHS